MPVCKGPECSRTDVIAFGLCPSHYRQQLRRRPLTPLRERGRPLVPLGTRVEPFVIEELGADVGVKAREVLTAWAERRRKRKGRA